jgi:hypothetical protein
MSSSGLKTINFQIMTNDNKQQKHSDSTDTAIAYSTCYAQPFFTRIWAMPNKLTFTIKPIKELVEKYVAKSKIIIDPFANQSSYGTITNDLNPEFDTDYHLDALTFLRKMETGKADLVLFDPPYSITQAAQCYKDYGKDKLERSVANMGYWADCKNEVARILKPNGIALICGWNSNGVGKNRGFEMLEILLVPHGGSKNDTIVTVERKLPDLFS